MVLEPEFIEKVMGSVEVREPVSMEKSCGVEPVSMV